MNENIIRTTGASAFVATGAATAHLVVLGRAGGLGMSCVVVCAIGAGLSLWGRFEWGQTGAHLAAILKSPRASAIGAIYTAWRTLFMIGKAMIHVPLGFALLAIAGGIIWEWGSNLYADLLALWIAWHGGNFVLRPLAGLFSAPSSDGGGSAATATRASLQRAGLIGEP